jgi:hypothetical protein
MMQISVFFAAWGVFLIWLVFTAERRCALMLSGFDMIGHRGGNPLPQALPKHMRVPDSVLYQDINGEAVLLSLDQEAYFGLDEVSHHMWNVLRASASLEEAYQALLAEYDVDADTLRADLQTFLQELEKNGLAQLLD